MTRPTYSWWHEALVEAGVEIVSTGSTAETIADAGLPVTPIEKVTGFPECLDGRVKTLHPMVHAGLLADLRLESHRAQIAELGVEPFDLLISNLYPFTATVASGASPDACIEQIDIGGPAMVRSSAKNHASVAVITSPEQYPQLLAALAAGGFTLAERQALAAAAFVHTATYDVAVASWMGSVVTDLSDGTGFPRWIGGTWEKVTGLRYGENPHQPAALYRTSGPTRGLASAQQLHGKEMSYNNYVDADAARRCRGRFRRACRRDHQTCEPVRRRGRVGHRRGASEGPCVRSDLGVRRRDRGQSARQCGDGATSRGDLHRGDHRAGVRRRGGRCARRQEEPPHPGGRAAAAWWRREQAHRWRAPGPALRHRRL